jgi:manganese/zinc/iron transport system ATP- binding protein
MSDSTPSIGFGPGDHCPSASLSIHNLTVAYQRRPVLWDVDLDLPPGRLVAIVGPNGAGKSTLLKALLGLIPRTTGDIRVMGLPMEQQRHRVGYVPQRESVDWDFPITAGEVVETGLYREAGWFRPLRRDHRERAREALAAVGMEAFAGRQVSQLSGGQQQRVFLARALARRPDVYLLDEPMAGVDAATEEAIFDILQRLRDEGRTVVLVHHDLQSVPEKFDHVVLLNGRVVAHGAVADVYTAENLRRTYGGKLTVLAEAGEALARRGRV